MQILFPTIVWQLVQPATLETWTLDSALMTVILSLKISSLAIVLINVRRVFGDIREIIHVWMIVLLESTGISLRLREPAMFL